MRIVRLNDALDVSSWWNYHKFLDFYLNHKKDETLATKGNYLIEAIKYSILKYALSYTKPQNIGPINEGKLACAICDAILLSDKLIGNLIKGYSANFITGKPKQINPNSVIQYANALYYSQENVTTNLQEIFRQPLVKEYANLLDNITSHQVNSFELALNEACEFHLVRSKDNMLYEFNTEDNILIPSELFATLKLRNDKGLELPVLKHPLIIDYDNLFANVNVQTSEMYRKVREKIIREYL
jgi:hypothetical protein